MLYNILKYHGGKGGASINKWVLSHYPKNYENLNYIELFCGAASLYLNKKPSHIETINDIDFEIYNLFTTVRDNLSSFLGIVNPIGYTEDNFLKWKEYHTKNTIELAAQTYILHNFSRGGLCKDFAWSERLRRNMPGDVSGYLTKRDKLGIISQRLQNTNIYNLDFRKILSAEHSPDTFIYCDPPYLTTTRTSKKIYAHEFTEQDHIDLIILATASNAKILISGYNSPIYSSLLSQQWNFYQKEVPNHSGQGKKKNKRIECLWSNFKE